MQIARQGEQHGKSVVGDIGALQYFAIGEDDVAVDERGEAIGFDTRAIDLDPLELFGGAERFRCDASKDSVGVGHLLQIIFRIGSHHTDLRRDALHFLDCFGGHGRNYNLLAGGRR